MTSIFRRHSRGRPPHPDVLTPAEWRVLEEIREGRSNPEIAERLGLSRNTVKTHISSMLSKLELLDREELAAWRGEPAVPSAGRSWLLAPLGWLTSKVAGGVAVAAVVAVVLGVVVVAMEFGRARNGADPIVAPSTTATEPLSEAPPAASDPSFAPDGRTGDPALDELIESLVHDDAATLVQRYAGTEAHGRALGTDVEQTYVTSEWAGRLASADRSLYAVLEGDPQAAPPRGFEVVLAVVEAGAEPVGWSFAVQDGTLIDIVAGSQPPTSYAPAVARRYDQYLVLPPSDDLPTSPAGHGLDVRTGDPAVDSLIAMVEAADGAALAAAVDYERRSCDAENQPRCPSGVDAGETDALRLRACGADDSWISPEDTARRLERIASITSALHGVVRIPEGYQPDAEHLITLVTQVAPYRWESAGIFEHEGRIVGLFAQCSDRPQGMYPPRAFVLAPPADPGVLDPSRASGVVMVDETVEALRVGDVETLDALTDWGESACVVEQSAVDAPPLCEPDEAPGTLIATLPVVSCEGGPRRRVDVGETFARLASPAWALHSVADIGPPGPNDWGFPPGTLEAILVVSDDTEVANLVGLSFGEEGIASVRFPCSRGGPEALMTPGRAPTFLLAPP